MTKARNQQEQIDRIGGIIAIIIIAVSAVIGFQHKIESRENQLKKNYPDVRIKERISPNLISFTYLDEKETHYLATGSGKGYGGSLSVAIIIDPNNKLVDAKCIQDRETPSFMARLERKNYSSGFKGIQLDESPGTVDWPDALTGATFTTEAMKLAVQKASGETRDLALGLSDWTPEKNPIHWEWKYLTLILVLFMAWLINAKWFPLKKYARWVLLLFNLIFLGFWFGNQLSISQITRLLSGDLPSLELHLFFYILLAGSVLFILLLNKNFYYDRICPFGAAQQCVNAISGTKRQIRHKYVSWFQRILVVVIICMGLIYQNPTRFNYEVFSTFFKLIGTIFQFSLLILVLLSSLFIVRPWCNVLCPVKPVMDFIRMVRNWMVR